MIKKKVYVGSDHAGFSAKRKIMKIVKSLGFEIEDMGPFTD